MGEKGERSWRREGDRTKGREKEQCRLGGRWRDREGQRGRMTNCSLERLTS